MPAHSRVRLRVAFVVIGLLISSAMAPIAAAESTECTGTISGTHQNVTVPSGSMCVMDGAIVTGNVEVEPEAGLAVVDSEIRGNVETGENSVLDVMQNSAPTTIGGNLASNRAAALMLFDVVVGGNVSFKETGVAMPGEMSMNVICNGTDIGGNTEILASGEDASWDIGSEPPCGNGGAGNHFGGNLLLRANEGSLDVDSNEVERKLQAFANTGGVDISDNTIGEALQCEGNDPPPTGGGNTAPRKEGQCAAF